MSLQTNVFENGRWVTRSIDPYHIRAQNMDAGPKEKNTLSRRSPAIAPSLGLLTKTLVRSSVIKWIIPARVRHQSKNDVLFITADCVALKESLGNYTLKDICMKADFDSHIRSARTIGDPRKLAWHDEYGYVERRRNQVDWEDHEAIVDLDAHYVNKRTLPPQIAIMVLESQKLVFLCAVNGTPEAPEWLSSHKELVAAGSPLEKLGEHIAVDPKSRVVAVAAQKGHVYLYALKSMEQMRNEFEEKFVFEPIKEERLLPNFPEGGIILKMEFLHPPLNDRGQIVLLLVVSIHRKSRMIWYEWNSGATLRESQLKPKASALQNDEQLPLLLIPLKLHFAAFMIICENCITLYRDISTGSPSRYVQHLDDVKDPEEPGSSLRRPAWVQWARPMRTPRHQRDNKFDDAIFLCREDGIVQYLELYNSIDHMLDSTHPAGRLGINVSTAFAILDVGPTTDDLLAAGGDMSEGGLWRVRAREYPMRLATVPDWTPLNDFATTTNLGEIPISIGSITNIDKVLGGPSRIFACTGRGKHGAISELRYGIAASKKLDTVNLDEGVDSGVLGIWAFHGYYGESGQQFERSEQWKDATYILISYPTRTSLLLLRVQLRQDPQRDRDSEPQRLPDPELVTVDLGIDYDARTITSAVTPYGVTIQVTETSIRTAALPIPPIPKDQAFKSEGMDDDEPEENELTARELEARYCYQFESSRVLTASIHILYGRNNHNALFKDTYILLALKIDEAYELQFGNFWKEYRPTASYTLPSQPSCLLLHGVCGHLLAVVATLDGGLQIFVACENNRTLHTHCGFKFEGPFAICDSLAIISSNSKDEMQSDCLVVCGLRDGLVVTLRLTWDAPWELSVHEQLRIGHVSVTAMADVASPHRAILHCGNVFCALEYPRDMAAPATASNIWITDVAQPLLQTGSLSTVTQAVASWVPGNIAGSLAGSFFCVDGKLLHIVSIEPKSHQQMVPRRLPLGVGPVRVIHSKHLHKLIVLSNKMTVPCEQHRDTPGTRSLRPSIVFLDPDKVSDIKPDPDEMDAREEGHGEESPADENENLILAELKPGEKFLGITEWTPKADGDEFHMLVVNTTLSRAEKPIGRLLFFAITPGDSSSPRLVLVKKIALEAPVYSVANYPEMSLVYCCGKSICMQTFELPDPSGSYNWPPPIKATIRSPGRFLTVREPLIYVSSTQESLAVFKYEDDRLIYQYGDQTVRDGLHHVHVPEHSLVLASDMNEHVVGLWQPPERRIDNIMPPVFEAKLSGSITRLRRVTRPVWYGSKEGDVVTDAFIGSSTDGTLTQFAILDKGWRLLRFIQNMAERNPLICHYNKPLRNRRLEPSTAKAAGMHINGDILQHLVDRGGERLLREMLDAEPEVGIDTDFKSAQARWVRFSELAEEVADDGFRKKLEEEGGAWDGEFGVYCTRMTMKWIRNQLRSAL